MTRQDDAGDGNPAPAGDGVLGLVAWLKRVTPEWPPTGVDWPLVLGYADRMFSEAEAPTAADREKPRQGQPLAEYIGSFLDSETIAGAEPSSRGYAFAALLLDAFSLLEACCTASLFLGYDLDALERPVEKLPPFHGLMGLGAATVEWIRSLRDACQADVEAATGVAAEPVRVGAAFGRNAHQAVWNLADEICRLGDFVTEGRLDAWDLTDQPPGAAEDAWWKLSEALGGRLPDAMEAKAARIRLESEARAAFAAGRPAAGKKGDPARRVAENPAPPATDLAEDSAQSASAGIRVGKKPHGHKLQFEPGGFVFRNVRVALGGKPLLVLEALANARGNALGLKDLQLQCWGEDSGSGEEAVRTAVSTARDAVRRALKAARVRCKAAFDPVKNVDRGANRTAWKLQLP